MNSKEKHVVSRIIETYEKILFSLASTYQQHWSLRLYRLQKERKYLQPIWSGFQSYTLYALPKIASEKTDEELGMGMLSGYEPIGLKKQIRLAFFKKNPGLAFTTTVAHYLFVAKSLNLSNLKGFNKYYELGINRLKKVDWDKILIKGELVNVHPSACANTIYYLKYLDVINLEDELLLLYKTKWLNFIPKGEMDWQNKVYALTHVIIAGSYFYQIYLENGKFDWILKFFEKDIDEIIKNTNPDIIAEVGLCFRLCKKNKNKTVTKIKKYIVSCFDDKKGYIPREARDTMSRAEHRNILAILLLADYD
ncbi:MAG TPA: DUF3541 domain-containing protein, partial [Nitrosopumilaceae archaeon]|nr:DUF3541 domain-containing protein [Nitrosopumilaceae archaeon]